MPCHPCSVRTYDTYAQFIGWWQACRRSWSRSLALFFSPFCITETGNPFDWIITGRIQSPCHLRFRPRRRPCSLGWNPARAGYHASIRSGYRGGLPGRAWTEQVLEMHRCKGLWTSWRYVFFFYSPSFLLPPSLLPFCLPASRKKKGGKLIMKQCSYRAWEWHFTRVYDPWPTKNPSRTPHVYQTPIVSNTIGQPRFGSCIRRSDHLQVSRISRLFSFSLSSLSRMRLTLICE